MKRKKGTGEKVKEIPADKQAGFRAVLRTNIPTYVLRQISEKPAGFN